MTTGIILIAIRNTYYIRMAYNLAVSLKAHNRSVKITLITDGVFNHLTDVQKFWFDKVIYRDNLNPFQLKTQLYGLSPYDQTIYLDVDMIANPARSYMDLISSLNGVDFTMANRGWAEKDKYDWADPDDFKEKAGIDSLLNLSSEFIYWRKCDKVKELFDIAANFYAGNTIIQRRIGGYQPDEPSFSFAMAVCNIEPHAIPFYPTYWLSNSRHTFTSHRTIQDSYYFLSMGGSFQDRKIIDLYKRYSLIAGEKMGSTPLPYEQKRTLVKERQHV